MRTGARKLGLLAPVLCILGGCYAEEDSCNVETAAVYVEYEITEDGDGEARARATFWTGDSPGGTYLTLGKCGDAISVNGEQLSLTGWEPEYYDGEVPLEEVYEFVFDREDRSLTSSVSVRPPVHVEAPLDGKFARDEGIGVRWGDNDSGEIGLRIDGECIEPYKDSVVDDGRHLLPGGSLDPYRNDSERCRVDLSLVREIEGSLHPDLRGEVVGRSVGETRFVSTPGDGEDDACDCRAPGGAAGRLGLTALLGVLFFG